MGTCRARTGTAATLTATGTRPALRTGTATTLTATGARHTLGVREWVVARTRCTGTTRCLTRQTAGPHSGRIEAFDPILQRLVRHPVPAAVTADDSAARSYGWALSGVRNQSGQFAARLDYRLTVRKADGQAWLTARAQGYENTMQGQGRCMTPDR